MSEAASDAGGDHKKHDPLKVGVIYAVISILSALTLAFEWLATEHLFALLLALTMGVLASEKLNKVILVLLAAGLCLFLGVGKGFLHTEDAHIPLYITMIDWGTIGIIIGSTVFVEIISRSGVFTFAGIKIMKLSRGDPLKLLIAYSILTCVFSAFLNNVTAMIIVGSLTVVSCRKLGFSPVPMLFAAGIFTNIGGLLTLISSVPNIIVGTEAKIGYVDFFVASAPFCLLASVATIFVVRLLFGVKGLSTAEEKQKAAAQVDRFDEWETVRDKRFFYLSCGVLAAVILAFALHDQIPVLNKMGLEVVAFIGATVMLVIYPTDVEEVLDRVEWSLVFFFVGLFALLGVMEHAHVLDLIGKALEGPLGGGRVQGSVVILWASALFSGVTDNIPLSAVLAKVLSSFGDRFAYQNMLWWGLIFGASLGGNLTPIGSASTVVAMMVMKKEGHGMSFGHYVKLAAPIVVMHLVLLTGYLFVANALGMLRVGAGG